MALVLKVPYDQVIRIDPDILVYVKKYTKDKVRVVIEAPKEKYKISRTNISKGQKNEVE